MLKKSILLNMLELRVLYRVHTSLGELFGGQFGNINLKTLVMVILSCSAILLLKSNAKEVIAKMYRWMFITALLIIMNKSRKPL